MEQEYMWVFVCRPSTESTMVVQLPHNPYDIKPSEPTDQLEMGEWCLENLGGEWLPLMFGRGTPSKVEKMREEFAQKWSEGDSQP